MRTRILILLLSPLMLLAVFTILSINAHSIDDTGTKSADQLIDESNGIGTPIIDTRFATNPHASRKAWGADDGTSSEVPSSLPSSTISPQDSRAKAESIESTLTNQNQVKNDQNATETASSQILPASSAATSAATSSAAMASGSWSLELKDSTLKEIVLTLFEHGNAVFGTGSMSNENSTLLVAASGFLDGDTLNLDLTTLGSINLYRLSLTTSGDSASGNYTAFSASGQSWIGSAEGIRSAPPE